MNSDLKYPTKTCFLFFFPYLYRKFGRFSPASASASSAAYEAILVDESPSGALVPLKVPLVVVGFSLLTAGTNYETYKSWSDEMNPGKNSGKSSHLTKSLSFSAVGRSFVEAISGFIWTPRLQDPHERKQEQTATLLWVVVSNILGLWVTAPTRCDRQDRWFQIVFLVTPIWGRFPFWLMFSKGLKLPTSSWTWPVVQKHPSLTFAQSELRWFKLMRD